jgi:hypothetical protein
MKDETDYYKMIYDRFVKEQKELGIWIEPEKAFDEQKKVLKKNKLFDKKKKPKKELSEEDIRNMQALAAMENELSQSEAKTKKAEDSVNAQMNRKQTKLLTSLVKPKPSKKKSTGMPLV